jgi:hypothetical protein
MPFAADKSVLRLLTTQALTTSADGSAVDLQGYINPGGRNIKVVADVGSNLGTTPSVTIKVQDSDTTTAADFADLYTGFTAVTATTGGLSTAHIKTNKRYLRAVATLTANTTSSNVATYILVENRVS